jgi:hypothetical protein
LGWWFRGLLVMFFWAWRRVGVLAVKLLMMSLDKMWRNY